MSDEPDRTDEPQRFWATWLPWRIMHLVGYGAFLVYLGARSWRPPIIWLWWAMMAAFAYAWIMFATKVANELRSFRRTMER
jgi:hypothetical protein